MGTVCVLGIGGALLGEGDYLSVASAGHTFTIQPELLTNLIIRQFDIRHKLPQNQQCRIKEGRLYNHFISTCNRLKIHDI